MAKGTQTDLFSRLKFPETRKKAIASVIRALRTARTVEATAETLGVGSRTLKRFLATDAELRAAWDEERATWGPSE